MNRKEFEFRRRGWLFQLSSQIVTRNVSLHSYDFNLGACVHLAKIKGAKAKPPSYSGFCSMNIRSVKGNSEEDVVRDLRCDNQEIQIVKRKRKRSYDFKKQLIFFASFSVHLVFL